MQKDPTSRVDWVFWVSLLSISLYPIGHWIWLKELLSQTRKLTLGLLSGVPLMAAHLAELGFFACEALVVMKIAHWLDKDPRQRALWYRPMYAVVIAALYHGATVYVLIVALSHFYKSTESVWLSL